MQVNLWLGNARNGSSTGLHHDFHDNLYVLLRGKKVFRLFAPSDAPLLYTYGAVASVHPNGRINYEGSAPTRADGVEVSALPAITVKRAQAALAKARACLSAALASGAGKGAPAVKIAQKAVKAARKRLETAEAALFDEGGFADDFDDCDDFDDSDGDGDDASGGAGGKKGKKAQRDGGSDSASGGDDDEDDEAARGGTEPPSFSKIGVDVLQGLTPNTEFPLYNKAKSVLCEVNAGQCLWLPAGWFHEVRS